MASATDLATVEVVDLIGYDFETDVSGWTPLASDPVVASLDTTTAEVFRGQQALAVTISHAGTGTDLGEAFVSAPATPAGAAVTYRVYVPSGTVIDHIQPFVQESAQSPVPWRWTGDYVDAADLVTDSWQTYTVTVPADAAMPLDSLGVEFGATGAGDTVCYIDAIDW